MRKTSQDGGDSTSITSGIENEIKKPGAIIKTKRNSIKRKVQNFSVESDDAVIEPLLQKEKNDTVKPSAKFNLLSKTKTEANSEKGTDKDKLISDDKLQKAALSNASDVTDKYFPSSSVNENSMSKLTSANAPLHNHMNTNVFSNHDGLKTYVAPKSQILVEIDGSKHVGYNPSPLIFTTAKIHTDGKTKHMEPVQMTPVPILSTIEVSVKNGNNTGETFGQVTSNISAVYIPQNIKNVKDPDPESTITTVSNTTTPQIKVADTKIQILTDKIDRKGNTSDKSSLAPSSNEEIKLSQLNIATTSAKDHFSGNKNKQNKMESQPISSTPEKGKTTAFTKMENSSIKETKKEKSDSWHTENKVHLIETVQPENVNSLDKTSKEKPKDSANTSLSNRQLQRQSIVLDKNDHMPKLKPNIVSPPITNDSSGLSPDIHMSGETNTLSDKTNLPKSSANSIPTTSVTSVSTNKSAADSKIYDSTTTAATLNKKLSSTTSIAAINQTVPSVINTSVTNNPTTTASTVKNMSTATNKVAVSSTTPSPITTAVADSKSSVPINAPLIANKKSAINIAASTKTSPLSTSSSNNKISSPATSIATSTKFPPTSPAANKTSDPMTTIAATNKMSTPSTSVASSTKTSPSPATTAGNKISSTNTAISKLSDPITSSTNKIPAVTLTINVASNKISAPSSTTTASSKVPKPLTTTSTTAINKISAPCANSVTGSKVFTTSNTTAGNKVFTASITSTAGNKISSTSTATTAANKKIPSPVITTTAIKMTSGSTTITTGVGKTFTSNSNSSVKPITSSSSTLPQLSNTPITKSATVTTPSASKPSIVSTFGNIKSSTPNETSKYQVTSTANTKPTSTTTSATPAKVTTAANPTSTSHRTTVVKSPTVTTAAKSVPTNTIPQPAVGKSAEITPKSSKSNENPTTAKTNSTSIPSTTTSGVPSATSTASSVSSAALGEVKKQSDSKSKVIGNGNKSFKA